MEESSGAALDDCQEDGYEDAGEENGSDERSVAEISVGHIEAGQRRGEEAYSDEQEKYLEGKRVVRFWRGCVCWMG